MLEQIERQDSETLLGLLHPAQGTRLEEAEKTFQSALASAMALDEAGGGADGETLARVSELFTLYRKVRASCCRPSTRTRWRRRRTTAGRRTTR
jgi:hypothetical protein